MSPFGELGSPRGIAFPQGSTPYDYAVGQKVDKLERGLFIDASALIGIFTHRVAVRLWSNGKILVLELPTARFSFLVRNVGANALANTSCLQVAAGSVDGVNLILSDLLCEPNHSDISSDRLVQEGRRGNFSV